MITYVNTVLVGTGAGTLASTIAGATNGQYIVTDNNGTILTSTTAAKAEAIKVGLKSNGKISWSNVIKRADLKSYTVTPYKDSSEDTVTFNFAKAVTAAASKEIRLVVRLTFKDLPTRFRKWTESYEITVAAASTAADIVDAFVAAINTKNAKRARVIASNSSNTLIVTAMAYDDDDVVDSISPANKVRFTANSWYTIPSAAGFDSKNKYAAATISKVPGVYSVGSAKLVRDAEAQAMGYNGIINRGPGTWPIIKPAMNVDLSKKYDSITIEFENMYRTADDLQRKTKQTLQVFDQNTTTASDGVYSLGAVANLKAVLDAFVKGEHSSGYEKFDTSDIDA